VSFERGLINKDNDLIGNQRKICLDLMIPSILIIDFKDENLDASENKTKKLQNKILELYENKEEVKYSALADPKLVVMFYLYLALLLYDVRNTERDQDLSDFFVSALENVCNLTGYESYKIVANCTRECTYHPYWQLTKYFPNINK
jgi:hypothetical protein